MIYIPILGALALAGSTILEKVVLKKRKIDIKLFQTATFLGVVLLILPVIYFFWKLTPEAFSLKNILIFMSVIVVSVIANLLLFFALKWEKVSVIEPAIIMEPLFTILLAVIFSFFTFELFERNFNLIIPALIASLALIFSHVKKHHLQMNKYVLAGIAGSFFFALEMILSRLILDFYSPVSFYFLRAVFVFLISLILFKPQFSRLNSKVKLEILLISALWIIYRVMVYYGYLNLGVVFTTLLIMLGPVFVYAFARIFLKEKLEIRNILAAIVIIACVIYATMN